MIDFEDFNYKMTHSVEEQLLDEVQRIINVLQKDAKSKASYGREIINKDTYVGHCDRAIKAFEVIKSCRSDCQV